MKPYIKASIKRLLSFAGYEVRKLRPDAGVPASQYPMDFDETNVSDILAVQPYTMTSPARIVSLTDAIKYIVANRVPGDIVECGVWKGGSIMASARALLREKDTSRNIYLFDTYEGMSEPTTVDVSVDGENGAQTLAAGGYDGANIGVEEVQRAVWGVGYPKDKFHFIKGKVEDTLPQCAPLTIALLRLDTDWYESTRHMNWCICFHVSVAVAY